MFQLRGVGFGEMDCAANPSDPVCVAYYGTTPAPGIKPATSQIVNAINSGLIVKTFSNNQSNPQGASTAGANVVMTGGASPIATSAMGLSSLFAKIPWWIKLGALLGGGYFAYTKWYKPKAS